MSLPGGSMAGLMYSPTLLSQRQNDELRKEVRERQLEVRVRVT